MKSSIILLLLLVSNTAFTQVWIAGRIVDEKTNKGISGVSVYVNNSTFGAETDLNGNFSFKCSLSGKTSLIISHIAYERKIYILEDNKTTNLYFSLTPKINRLSEVIIKSRHNKVDLTKWINLFTYNLLGVYKSANHLCKIKNTDALYFDFDLSSNVLKVYATEPLIIKNDFLYYKITVDLDQFEYDFNKNEMVFKYFAYYEDLPVMVLSAKQVRKNRIFAYEGSAMHLMRSIYRDNLEAESFYIYKYSAQINKEKARVEAIIRKKTAEAYAQKEVPNTSLNSLFFGDTLKYYKDVMKQESIFKIESTPLAIGKFITKDRKNRIVNLNFFQDTITITYDKNKLSREKKIQAAIAKNKNITSTVQPIYLYSYLYLFKEGGINIQSNGYYPESGLFMYGDMSERRIAVSLPYDFDPDEVSL